MIDTDLRARPRSGEGSEGQPEGVLDLRAYDNCWTGCQREYKWPHDDGRKHRCPGIKVVADAKPLRGRQVHANLFPSFANRSRQQIGIAGIAATAGKGDRSEERRVGKECRSRWSPYH